MKRWGAAALFVILCAAAIYQFLLRADSISPRLRVARASAVIGAGKDAVGVSGGGIVLVGLPLPAGVSLPRLPISKAPRSGRLGGTVLAQARVLAAAPEPLRPYLKDSRYGASGVDVELSSGVELRFGSDAEAARKWRAAAAVLADPSINALDYIDLEAPGRPGVYGSGHPLPPAP